MKETHPTTPPRSGDESTAAVLDNQLSGRIRGGDLRVKTTTTTIAMTVALLLAGVGQVNAQDSRPYLSCSSDSNPGGGLELIVDRTNMKLIHLTRSGRQLGEMPMTETETEYVVKFELDGTVMYRLAINRFTLRYSMYSPWPGPQDTTTGRCQLSERRL